MSHEPCHATVRGQKNSRLGVRPCLQACRPECGAQNTAPIRRNILGGSTGCGKSLNRDDSPPQGLKPSLVLTYAALKRRSTTVQQAFVTFSAACEAVFPDLFSMAEAMPRLGAAGSAPIS